MQVQNKRVLFIVSIMALGAAWAWWLGSVVFVRSLSEPAAIYKYILVIGWSCLSALPAVLVASYFRFFRPLLSALLFIAPSLLVQVVVSILHQGSLTALAGLIYIAVIILFILATFLQLPNKALQRTEDE